MCVGPQSHWQFVSHESHIVYISMEAERRPSCDQLPPRSPALLYPILRGSHTLTRRMDNTTRTGTVVAPTEAGMVATSQPLAVRAGVEALAAGGTAADAAIAAAAVLCVVEPRATGVGGDAFALYWSPGAAEPTALDGAGPAAATATVDAVRASGHDRMPSTGPWTVTTGGAPRASRPRPAPGTGEPERRGRVRGHADDR
jgi:hypothetical protein